MDSDAIVRATRQGSRVSNLILAGAASLIGLGIAAVSVTINYQYAIGRGETWAALAVLAAIGATVAPGCFPSLPNGARIGATLALALCLAVSGLNALGAASHVRTTAAVVAEDSGALRVRARDAYARAERDLAILAPAKPSSELDARISALMASRRDLENNCLGWQRNSRARAVCIEVNDIRPELARAHDRERLRTEMDRASDELTKLDGRRTVANADAAMLVAALSGIGLVVSADTANRLAALIAALLTELGGGLFLGMAVSLVGRDRVRPIDRHSGGRTPVTPADRLQDGECPVECPVTPEPAVRASAVKFAPFVSGRASGKDDPPDGGANSRILQALAARSGVLLGSQRSIAEQVGLSKSRTNEALNELASAGRVRLTVTPKGSVVQLVG